MAASMSRTSAGNHKVLLAALLCITAAASFLPGSSASTPLVAQTCGRTSNQRLCVSLLESKNRSLSATTVRELAIIGLSAARRSVLRAMLRARLRALDLSHGARRPTPSPVGRLVARCAVLYRDCLQAALHPLSRVAHMPAYDDRVADAVTALRVFPEKCQRLFNAREIVSPLEQVNRDTDAKLGIASEIVRLLSPSPSRHGDVQRTNV